MILSLWLYNGQWEGSTVGRRGQRGTYQAAIFPGHFLLDFSEVYGANINHGLSEIWSVFLRNVEILIQMVWITGQGVKLDQSSQLRG